MYCHPGSKIKNRIKKDRNLVFALAGNANVGKSVIFNRLTGSNQIIGNWPGKTVERAEGFLSHSGFEIRVVDLPGIYSLSTFSMEELVTRKYIAYGKPDVVIDVVDASVLERNLYFTLQLIEMEIPLVICLNQVDVAERKGIKIDVKKLQGILGVPIVSTIAVKGIRIKELIEKAVDVALKAKEGNKPIIHIIKYSDDIEKRITKLTKLIASKKIMPEYSPRWIAIKLLEDDQEIKRLVASEHQDIIHASDILAKELSALYKKPCFAVIAMERYAVANRVAKSVEILNESKKTILEKLDHIATHKVFGHIISAGVIVFLLLWTFTVGDLLSTLLSDAFSFFEPVDPIVSGSILSILWNGMFGGFVAGITLVIPYVIPFYFVLALIEDSGILTRVAFMMDSFMHKIGLHGKAVIPLILGYGCNVPAIHSCRIMETRRESLLASFTITFAPCAARTIVILGLVATFIGVEWALVLYALDILIIFIFGRLAFKALPGPSTGLIMEIHSFRLPSISVVTKQTWTRTKSIIYMVFPIYIIGSALVQALYSLSILNPINSLMAPLVEEWLGLPTIAATLLIFGVIRKEFILLMLPAIYGTANLTLFLSPVQLLTLAIIGMLYLPCLSTMAILVKEYGWKAGVSISLANLISAVIVGGIAYRLFNLIF